VKDEDEDRRGATPTRLPPATLDDREIRAVGGGRTAVELAGPPFVLAGYRGP